MAIFPVVALSILRLDTTSSARGYTGLDSDFSAVKKGEQAPVEKYPAADSNRRAAGAAPGANHWIAGMRAVAAIDFDMA